VHGQGWNIYDSIAIHVYLSASSVNSSIHLNIGILLLSGASVCQCFVGDISTCTAMMMWPCVEVNRHAARVIFLEYVGDGPIDTTLMLVGKVWLN